MIRLVGDGRRNQQPMEALYARISRPNQPWVLCPIAPSFCEQLLAHPTPKGTSGSRERNICHTHIAEHPYTCQHGLKHAAQMLATSTSAIQQYTPCGQPCVSPLPEHWLAAQLPHLFSPVSRLPMLPWDGSSDVITYGANPLL